MKMRMVGLATAAALVPVATYAAIVNGTYYIQQMSSAEIVNTFGGDESEARDVNNAGKVVGWARTASGIPHAFLFDGGPMLDIGASQNQVSSSANGINNIDEVVGRLDGPHAFYWHSGVGLVRMSRQLQSDQSPDMYAAEAFAINDYGKIVGHIGVRSLDGHLSFGPCEYDVAAQWANAYAAPQAVYCPGEDWGNNDAYDISNSGWIAGKETNSSSIRGFRHGGGVTTFALAPSGQSWDWLSIHGVNESGDAVGSAEDQAAGTHAVFWDGNSANSSSALPLLTGGTNAIAYEVNDQSFVAGYSERSVPNPFGPAAIRKRAFIWHEDFGTRELPVPAGFFGQFTDCEAKSLNNRGSQGAIRIVGWCSRGGKKRAVRWDVVVARQLALPITR